MEQHYSRFGRSRAGVLAVATLLAGLGVVAPVAAPIASAATDVATCEGTSSSPSGAVANTPSVWTLQDGTQENDYSEGDTVFLYDNMGQAISLPDGSYTTSNIRVPFCGVSQDVNGDPAPHWRFCTDENLYGCADQPAAAVEGNDDVDADGSAVIAALLRDADVSTKRSRALLQIQIWCVSEGTAPGSVMTNGQTYFNTYQFDNSAPANFESASITNAEATCFDQNFRDDAIAAIPVSLQLTVDGPVADVVLPNDGEFTLDYNFVGEIDLSLVGGDGLEICPTDTSSAVLDGDTLLVSEPGATLICVGRSAVGTATLTAVPRGLTLDSLGWTWSGDTDCQVFADFAAGLIEGDAVAAAAEFVGYDLALAKTVDVAGEGLDLLIDYTIIVANQGTDESGEFTVVDWVPAGLDFADISGGGVYDALAGTITWSLTGLSPANTLELSFSATIADPLLRPYENYAEIVSDSGDDYDSTPDTIILNDYGKFPEGYDNESIDDAGVGADPEDDADSASFYVDINYDLALAKTPSATTIDPDGSVTFTITVENQGNVASGEFTVTDTLPEGTVATEASDSGVITPTTVTWTGSDLAPGDTQQFTVTVEVIDVSLRPFKNIAEISSDGADDYSIPDTESIVRDSDSFPDDITNNDNCECSGDGYGTFENPENDLDDIADVDTLPNGADDADVAFFDVPVLYDLALVKTSSPVFPGSGIATFTIQIVNQGNVPSGNFTVVDTIPGGLTPTSASNGGSIVGQLVTWNLSGLAPGASISVTVAVQVTNFAARPWVNVAEIVSDGADSYDSDGYEQAADGDVEDDDSTPDSNTANDVVVDQTALPASQHNDPAVDEDDHDVSSIDAAIVYDLALIKSLPLGQSFKKDSDITFNIVVKNQGNVPSGAVTVQDVIPAGLVFVSGSDGALNAGQNVSWDLASLAPGQTKTLTLVVKIVDVTLTSYINYAEIVADGADAYDQQGQNVEDKDSTPDSNIANDPLVDNDDVNIDSIVGDEDDHDRALLDVNQVRSDNPVLGRIPATGSDSESPLRMAAALMGLGALALVSARRRRRTLA